MSEELEEMLDKIEPPPPSGWQDLALMEFPESSGIIKGKEYADILHDKLISQVNYLFFIAQFIAAKENGRLVLEKDLEILREKRKSIIHDWLVKYKEIPNTHKRSLEMMTAYIEKVLAVDQIVEIDNSIEEEAWRYIDLTSSVTDMKLKYECLQISIRAGIALVESINGKNA